MANYSAADAAGTIFPIIGMGIGLGMLAHTARGITDTMYGTRRYERREHRPRYSKPVRQSYYKKPKLTYQPRRTYSYRPRLTKIKNVRPLYNWKY